MTTIGVVRENARGERRVAEGSPGNLGGLLTGAQYTCSGARPSAGDGEAGQLPKRSPG